MNDNKKIAILTLPIEKNVGGILQAFALQQYLNQRKVKSTIISHRNWKSSKTYREIKYQIKRILKKNAINENSANKQKKIFINTHLKTTFTYSQNINKLLRNQKFSHLIIGSDQVWNLKYTHNPNPYFAIGVDDQNIKICTYSASLGNTKPNEILVKFGKDVFNKFSQISLREKDHIESIMQLNSNTSFTLDPTLLIDRSIYDTISSKTECISTGNNIAYLLDITSSKRKFLDRIAEETSRENTTFYANEIGEVLCNGIELSIEQWMRGIKDSHLIITDSYHGMVFSIIYEKNFFVIGNHKRGMGRFTSLLSELNLLDRMIDENKLDEIKLMHKADIDYKRIKQKLSALKKQSTNYLDEILR